MDIHWERIISEIEDYAIVLIDKKGVIINWNKGAESIKGYKPQDVLGKNFRIFYPAEDRNSGLPEQLIEEAIKNGKAFHEGWRVRKDGTRFWGSVVITALHDDNGEVIYLVKVTRDLTERKRSEDLLKQKNTELEQMNNELAAFAYVASHDLQAPLRKIQSFTSRFAEVEEPNLSGHGQEMLQRIQRNAARMEELIRDLLAFARTSAAEHKFEWVDLNEELKTVTKDLEETIAEKAATIDSSPLPVLVGIPFQLHQLLTNLISNALKFSKQDVPLKLTITADIVKGDMIKGHQATPWHDYHHLVFSDNGIGFESEFNAKVFDVFQRLHSKSKYSGSGVGLAICKRIVENHNGIITANGETDKGAVFEIYLPVKKDLQVP
ncbi:MAG TPA: PAS domain S-box protein [Ohtaekwangia sp.]|nr:PAS domain S-box protein [Ohtaekwangia sp.]